MGFAPKLLKTCKVRQSFSVYVFLKLSTYLWQLSSVLETSTSLFKSST
ncbi:unnamed protein product [Brassica oleracea var. botrytis]|uniref:(rape) hypothetical protein n=1 Tax=Brassica napus TaxID=3708 RepID=A0A816JIY3_BRANA|nr:unnamed protein product [Brassica napus]